MYKLIENEESVYKVILKEENSIKSEHTGKVLDIKVWAAFFISPGKEAA